MTKYLSLFVIIVLFLITRLLNISQNPPSVYWDEASIGYNAYSIIKTGHDEWGRRFPVHFRAFGEFKLPIYIYSTALTESIFGLNSFAIRLPAVIYSLLSIYLVYRLGLLLFKNRRISLASAFFMTAMPGFFIFSRTGYEASAGLFFYLLGIYLFLHKGVLFNCLSALMFVFSIYSYNSFRVLLPFTLALLFVYKFWRFKFYQKDILGLILFLSLIGMSLIPLYRLYGLDAGMNRITAVGISNEQRPFETFALNYVKHFSPEFLITKGDQNLRSQQPNWGQLGWIEFILATIGIISLFIIKKRNNWLILTLLIIAPIPAAITKESPHALRSLTLVPAFSIISALGLEYLSIKLNNKFIYPAVIFLSLVSFFIYFYNFISIYPKISSRDWQYGYKLIFDQYQKEFASFNHVVITDREAQPYIFALYYLQYNPTKFKKEVNYNPVSDWGFSTVRSFDSFTFEKIDFKTLPTGRLLIFATPYEKINAVPLRQIKNLDGSLAFNVYEITK